jgi:hypothetical protein
MNEIIIALVAHLNQNCPQLKYISADWGQLDYYSNHPPVQWPCALVDVTAAQYTNLSQGGQLGAYTLLIRIAALPLTNSSAQAPNAQKEQALAWWQLLEDVHLALQGFIPGNACTPLLRTAGRRTRRDDGVMLWEVNYSFSRDELMPELGEIVARPNLRILKQIIES